MVRDPVDVSFSFYKFFEGWLFEPGHVHLDEFIQQFVLGRGASSFRRGFRLGDHRWIKLPLEVQQRTVRPGHGQVWVSCKVCSVNTQPEEMPLCAACTP